MLLNSKFIKKKLRNWSQIICPHICIFCEDEALLENNPATCSSCSNISWNEPRCQRCQRSCHFEEQHKSRCYRCKSISYPFKSFKSIGPYRKSLRKAILRAKFFHDPLSLRFLNHHSSQLSIPVHENSVWSYIPSAPKRLKERGVKQQHLPLMFEKLRKKNDQTFVPLLLKNPNRRPQIELNEKERRQGLDSSLNYCGPLSPPQSVVLFDDVWSTGTTLNSACRVLKDQGIAEIHVVTLAFNDLNSK